MIVELLFDIAVGLFATHLLCICVTVLDYSPKCFDKNVTCGTSLPSPPPLE